MSILVVCSDESHDNKTAKVATFERNRRMVPGSLGRVRFEEGEGWTLRVPNWDRGKTWGDKVKDSHGETRLRGDEPTKEINDSSFKVGRLPGADPVRSRFRLECPLCGLTVSAREEKLNPLLDKARKAGVSEIPLAALAATL